MAKVQQVTVQENELRFDTSESTDGYDPTTGVGNTKNDWLKETYDGYDDLNACWKYVDDHYTSDLLKDASISDYLIKRKQSEHADDYNERKTIAAYEPYLASVVDSINGMLFANDDQTERSFQEVDEEGQPVEDTGLGDPNVRGTAAYRVWHNTDGRGLNYLPFLQRLLTELLKYNVVYILEEGVVGAADPKLVIVPPSAVTNFFTDSEGNVTDRILKHKGDTRSNIQDEVKMADRYTHYSLDGWITYEKGEQGGYSQIGAGTYTYWRQMEKRQKMLPLIRVALPMSRNVAYNAARQANRIFNTQSEVQSALRKGLIARLKLVYEEQNQLKAMAEAARDGFNAIQDNPNYNKTHNYIHYPIEAVTAAREQLKEWIDSFYDTTFQQYNDSARERTATEVKWMARAGIESILTLCADALDEAEKQIMFLRAQTEFPNDSKRWGAFDVKRSKKFQPVDMDAVKKNLKEMYFGADTVPVGLAGLKDAATRIADMDDISTEDVERGVEERSDQGAVDSAAANDFGLSI